MKTALLIRINAWHEVWGTHAIVDEIKRYFDVTDVITVATPQTDTLKFLQHDPRYKEIILFPPNESQQKTLTLWRKIFTKRNFDYSILAFDSELPERQPKHLISLFLSPGKKYFYQTGVGFFRVWSTKGFRLLYQTITFQLSQQFKLRWQKKLCKKPPQFLCDLTNQPIKRILWMRPDHLGDVVMTLPTLKILKHYFPIAEIDALVRPESAEMLKPVNDFNQIHILNIKPYTDTPMSNTELQELKVSLTERHYDLSIDFRGDDTLRKLTYNLKIPFRVGHSDWKVNQTPKDYSFLLTHPIDYPMGAEHSIEKNVGILEKIGLHSSKIIFTLNVEVKDLKSVQTVLRNKNITSKFAIIHAQSRDYTRGWSSKRFAQVANYLVRHYGFQVLITGAPVNSKYNEEILNKVEFPSKVHNAAGWFTLTELPALLKLAIIMVTIDSGPMHMAAAVGTPLVAMMLPNFTNSFYPYGQQESVMVPTESDIISLAENKENEGLMLKAITVKAVTNAIDRVLREKQSIHQ